MSEGMESLSEGAFPIQHPLIVVDPKNQKYHFTGGKLEKEKNTKKKKKEKKKRKQRKKRKKRNETKERRT